MHLPFKIWEYNNLKLTIKLYISTRALKLKQALNDRNIDDKKLKGGLFFCETISVSFLSHCDTGRLTSSPTGGDCGVSIGFLMSSNLVEIYSYSYDQFYNKGVSLK